MRVLSWNIAGAHMFAGSTEDAISYEEEDLDYFITQIKDSKSDIILLQESHTPLAKNLPSHEEKIAMQLGYAYFVNQEYGNSHIKTGEQLALAIISKYPITHSYFHKLPNPQLTVKRPNGDTWVTLDVGFLTCEIKYNGQTISVANCHLVPLHYFHRDYMEQDFQNIRDDISQLLLQLLVKPTLVGGDFNFSNLKQLLAPVFGSNKYEEAFENIETTPGRGQQDHILFSHHWKLQNHQVEKAKSDHYKCICDFVIKY